MKNRLPIVWNEGGFFQASPKRARRTAPPREELMNIDFISGRSVRITMDRKGSYWVGRKRMSDLEVFKWFAKNYAKIEGEGFDIADWAEFLQGIAAKLA